MRMRELAEQRWRWRYRCLHSAQAGRLEGEQQTGVPDPRGGEAGGAPSPGQAEGIGNQVDAQASPDPTERRPKQFRRDSRVMP